MRLPKSPPALNALLERMGTGRVLELLAGGTHRTAHGRYLHWDTLRHMPPPEGLDSEEWWVATKLGRLSNRHELPYLDQNGEPFSYTLPVVLQQRLHKVDQDASGRVEVPGEVVNQSTRDRYILSSLFEEAITSSQLEGASTAHRIAKAMLREGRKPRDRSEQMIVNNYRGMQFVRDMVDEPLTEEMLCELHRIVTHGTLKSRSAEGTFRSRTDDIKVVDNSDNTILHEPPHAGELPERVQRLCKFANQQTGDGDHFIHPVVRSILLHFMVGYDHPFVDGNGRTARALFYWSMARHRYWLMEFVSISTILRRAPAQYARAFLYTETDDNDTTYFIDFNLRIIARAILQLHEYIARKSKEVRSVEQLLGSSRLNHRQVALLSHALKHPGTTYTIQSHQTSHNVTYQTARTDLLHLTESGLLIKRMRGRAFAFRAAPDISERLETVTD